MIGRSTAAGLAFGAILFAPSAALAEGFDEARPLVELTVDPCIGAPIEAVRRAAFIELGALLAEDSGDTPSTDRTRVGVRCESKLVKLRVDDPITGKSIERAIDLSAASSEARPRLLAIAITELVSASWTELETTPEPKVPPAGPRSPAKVRRAALKVVKKWAAETPPPTFHFFTLVGTIAFVGEGGRALPGIGARFEGDWTRYFGWMADFQFNGWVFPLTLGRVSAETLSLGAAIALHQEQRSVVDVRFGLGVRGRPARLRGVSADPQAVRGEDHVGGWGGPMCIGSVSFESKSRWLFQIASEAGYVVAPFAGLVAGHRQIAMDGLWLTVQVGLGISF